MKLVALVFVVTLIGCGGADDVDLGTPSPQQQTACAPRRYAWLTYGAKWAFEITNKTGSRSGTRRVAVTLGTPKQTGDFTLYPVTWDAPLLSVPGDENLFWPRIGTSKCGDIVVGDEETVYTVYSAATDSWTGMGFFRELGESAMVYTGAEMIPSMFSEEQPHGGLTAIGNVAGNADGCSFYAHYGTYCTSGDWASVDLEFEYWDSAIGPAGYHRSFRGNEYRIERAGSEHALHREPDSAARPWPTEESVTGELGPLDTQDFVAVPTRTAAPTLEWAGEAKLELTLVASGETAPVAAEIYSIKRVDAGTSRVVWTLTVKAAGIPY